MRVIVFCEEGFPFVDAPGVQRDYLQQIDADVRFCTTTELETALADADVFLNPYGSAFPKAAWTAIKAYLTHGGCWVNLGGNPLSRPIRKLGSGWKIECSQRAYAKQLGINQAYETPVENIEWCWEGLPIFQDSPPLSRPNRCWSLQVRFAAGKEFPLETGSTDMRLARLDRLVGGWSGDKLLSAPLISIDRLRGEMAGGRWVLLNAELAEPLDIQQVANLCEYAAARAVEFSVRPSFACVNPGESSEFLTYVHLHKAATNCHVVLEKMDSSGQALSTSPPAPLHTMEKGDTGDSGDGVRVTASWHSKVQCPATAETGLHTYKATLLVDGKLLRTLSTGFWVYDSNLMASGEPLLAGEDYFSKGGEPFPVTGTTYMAGDVHRKFLFEPNPAVWDKDFAAMKAAGVNVVRTGIWTGWYKLMLEPGAVDEGAVRALQAYVLTARRHDVHVIFNFFAFLPPTWGGENPYFDPRSTQAQKAFITAFVSRFTDCRCIHWDLINEPSFSSPPQEWSTRPNHDRFEQKEWEKWLLERADKEEWQERWRTTTDDLLALPALEDFQDKQIYQGTHPFKALTYRLFAQEMFTRWATEMTEAIKAIAPPEQLVTVGQDEGGTGERPAPHWYADAVDYTTNHTWWQNDDLLWDCLFTKVEGKPNLIQETGIMFVEGPDGSHWRSPRSAADLLSHKMALSFAGGCAGFIQWLWNTNVYMDSDNEVGIGFLRADGTEKPELEEFRRIAADVWASRCYLKNRRRPDVVIFIPHSNLLSVRHYADVATRTAVKALEEGLGIATRCVSEYRLQDLGQPDVIFLPSPRILSDESWKSLADCVENGSTLVVTGFVEADEYWRPVSRLNTYGVETSAEPVKARETISGCDEVFHFSIDGHLRADKAAGISGVTELAAGKGKLVIHPLPVELSGYEPTLRFYAATLNRQPQTAASYTHKQAFEGSVMTIAVNNQAAAKLHFDKQDA